MTKLDDCPVCGLHFGERDCPKHAAARIVAECYGEPFLTPTRNGETHRVCFLTEHFDRPYPIYNSQEANTHRAAGHDVREVRIEGEEA